MIRPCRKCGRSFEVGDDNQCASCRELERHPDALSKKTSLGGAVFADLQKFDEGERIRQIAQYLTASPGRLVGVMVETSPGYEGKGDRYVKGVRELVPAVQIAKRNPGPVRGVETICFILPNEVLS